MYITEEELGQIFPKCPAAKRGAYAEALSTAMDEGDIGTVTRAAAFLGQIGLESGQLRWWTEFERDSNPGFVEYERGRRKTILGNVNPGDGARYKGRGPIQLTGRNNYRAAGEALGLDLEGDPEQVATNPEVGFAVAVWYWNSRNLNDEADDIAAEGERAWKRITKAINGGYLGHAERTEFYHRALEVLGASVWV
jgi:predicted chitinase